MINSNQVSVVEAVRMEMQLVKEAENAANAAAQGVAAMMQDIEASNAMPTQDQIDAVQLTQEAKYAAVAALNAVTATGPARTLEPLAEAEFEAEANSVVNAAAAVIRASGLDAGLSSEERQIVEFLNMVAETASDLAKSALDLYPSAAKDPAIPFACVMSVVCAGNTVKVVDLIRPRSTSKLLVPA